MTVINSLLGEGGGLRPSTYHSEYGNGACSIHKRQTVYYKADST